MTERERRVRWSYCLVSRGQEEFPGGVYPERNQSKSHQFISPFSISCRKKNRQKLHFNKWTASCWLCLWSGQTIRMFQAISAFFSQGNERNIKFDDGPNRFKIFFATVSCELLTLNFLEDHESEKSLRLLNRLRPGPAHFNVILKLPSSEPRIKWRKSGQMIDSNWSDEMKTSSWEATGVGRTKAFTQWFAFEVQGFGKISRFTML